MFMIMIDDKLDTLTGTQSRHGPALAAYVSFSLIRRAKLHLLRQSAQVAHKWNVDTGMGRRVTSTSQGGLFALLAARFWRHLQLGRL